MAPQLVTLLNHLYRAGSISNVEAQSVHRIRALPRRIADLKGYGCTFKREFRQDVTGQRYVRYTMTYLPPYLNRFLERAVAA